MVKDKGRICGDKTALYGVGTQIIFVYGGEGGIIDVFDCYIDEIYIWILIYMI